MSTDKSERSSRAVSYATSEINGHTVRVYPNWVTPSLFETMQTPMLLGRTFYPNEKSAVIVSQSLAPAQWPQQNPLGKLVGDGKVKDLVIGIVADAHVNALNDDDAMEEYWPAAEQRMTGMVVIARMEGARWIGACTSAFRLIDALLLRPLPVSEPQQLYALAVQVIVQGKPQTFDSWAYPAFQLMRDAVKDQAELIAISYSERTDLTYGSDAEMEKAYRQYVSGSMFSSFGLRPAAGRLFTERDDLKPRAHPYAVLSYDYWTSRFWPRSQGDRSHLSHRQGCLPDYRCRPGTLHRNRARDGNRHLYSDHDASGRAARGLELDANIAASEAQSSD